MRDAVARNLSRTAVDMPSLVWPAISNWLGGGNYFPVESVAEASLTKDLDMYAGIDGFQKRLHVIRGIASRIQWTDSPFDTFTLRKSRSSGTDTEIKKRLWQLAHRHEGYLYPHITVQAYVNKKRTKLLSVAVAYTHELIPWAYQTFAQLDAIAKLNRHTKAGVWQQSASDEDGTWATFLAVDWDVYQSTGLYLQRWSYKDNVVLGMPMPQFLGWVEEMEAMQV